MAAKFSNQGKVGRPIDKARHDITLLEEKGGGLWTLVIKDTPGWKKGELVCTFTVMNNQLWNVTEVTGPAKFVIKKKT
jgi:hypothetical protein